MFENHRTVQTYFQICSKWSVIVIKDSWYQVDFFKDTHETCDSKCYSIFRNDTGEVDLFVLLKFQNILDLDIIISLVKFNQMHYNKFKFAQN